MFFTRIMTLHLHTRVIGVVMQRLLGESEPRVHQRSHFFVGLIRTHITGSRTCIALLGRVHAEVAYCTGRGAAAQASHAGSFLSC